MCFLRRAVERHRVRSYCQRMQDVDRVSDVQLLALPARSSRVSVQAKSVGLVQCSQKRRRRIRHLRRWRNVGHNQSTRPPELKLAIRQSLTLVPLFVHGAVVTAAQEGEVRQGSGPAVGPVANVMALAEAHERSEERRVGKERGGGEAAGAE